MTREEKIICKDFLNDADKTHSCNEYKLLMALLEQEPFKPMVEIDLYSVVKSYIEREVQEVLDKIRAEIDKARFIDKDTRIVKNALASGLEVAMQIIDKYKAESEDEDDTN